MMRSVLSRVPWVSGVVNGRPKSLAVLTDGEVGHRPPFRLSNRQIVRILLQHVGLNRLLRGGVEGERPAIGGIVGALDLVALGEKVRSSGYVGIAGVGDAGGSRGGIDGIPKCLPHAQRWQRVDLGPILIRLARACEDRPHVVEEQTLEVGDGASPEGSVGLVLGLGLVAIDAHDKFAGEQIERETHFFRLRPRVADSLQGAIPAIPLTGFAALTTAFANDVDGDLAFAQLTHALGRPGDMFIGLSTSGNARNVCAAATVARIRGLRTLGLTGASGGMLAPLCDICLRVPTAETFRAQEFHLPIYHCLSLMLEDEFFAPNIGALSRGS